MSGRKELGLEDPTHRLPGGNLAICRKDGVVQIGNEEVTRTDILMLAEHLRTCVIFESKPTKKARR